MPRTRRASQGGYHVLNRGNARRTVFHKEDDYDSFLKLLLEAGERTPIRLLSCCLMPNHFHLAAWPVNGKSSLILINATTVHMVRPFRKVRNPRLPRTDTKAHVSYAASYFDKANRTTDTVNVGTSGGSAYTRPGAVPSRSDTVLVNSFGFNR